MSERWLVPWWWWLAALALSLGAAAEVHGGADGWRAVVPYVVLPVLAIAALAWLSRQQVSIRDGVLHVPGARAPVTAFGPAEVLTKQAYRQWRGTRAQRDAWVRVRPWFRTGVLLPVVDPEDDTPYWLIGSRQPQRLADHLRA
jgi:hypothetical protein